MDPIETEMCRYCIQQCQKLRSGKVHEHSCFCPIELFGSPLKRLHALVSLLQTPQNNLSLRVTAFSSLSFHVDDRIINNEIASLCGSEALSFTKGVSSSEKVILLLLSKVLQTTGLLEALRSVQVVDSGRFHGRMPAS